MLCPNCKKESRQHVHDSRPGDDGYIHRRRKCQLCGSNFSTIEIPNDKYGDLIKTKVNYMAMLAKR